MKIISAYTENIKEMSDISFNSYQKYCNKNNIEFKRYLITQTDRPPSWYKVQYILNEFKNGTDTVLWVDADTLLINNEFDINSIFDKTKYVYLSEDLHGINCGVMMWRKSIQTIEILEKMWDSVMFLNHVWWEQAAFRYLYKKNYNKLQKITSFIPQNILNAYDYLLYNLEYPKGQVSKESFIFHLPGLPVEQRLSIMKNFKI